MSPLYIVDVGLGNASSVANMIQRLGHDAELRRSPDGLDNDDRYILPGVGAFDEGVGRLQASGWFDHLQSAPSTTHILGLCLGMQLLARASEEGVLRGLNRVPASFLKFRGKKPVPHMGWNSITKLRDDPIFDPDTQTPRYYFTHSYHAICDDPGLALASTSYGLPFTAAYRQGNTYGVQFHPEKSHKYGMSLFSRWIASSC